jgi:hypothetical protein
MSNYLNQFLSLRCAGDVLNVVAPLGKEAAKEITESMAIIHQLKKIVLTEENKMKYTLVELCAGNALTSILAVHMLPIKKAIAIDKKERNGKHFENVQRFEYLIINIYDTLLDTFWNLSINKNKQLIFISVRACNNLANRIIELYKNTPQAKYLILLPCWVGNENYNFSSIVRNKLGKYLSWCYTLALKAGGTFVEDRGIISPCNGIVLAKK